MARFLLVALLAFLAAGAHDAAAADDAARVGTQTVQSMELPATVTEVTPAPEDTSPGAGDAVPGPEGSAPEGGEAPPSGRDTPLTPGQTAGIAGSQPSEARLDEYERSCNAKVLWPVSPLASIGGSVVTDRQDRWPWALLVIAALILIPLLAVKERRRRTKGEDKPSPATGRLETTATIVGIAVALPAIAGLFFPGVGIKHHPPAQATMAVREVQARVTRGEFVRRAVPPAERPRLRREDRREVGHVVWVELGLAGFRGDDLTLTWASYSRAGGYSLIPRTDNAIRVDVGEDSDAETRFVPIWVGLPKQKFQVRFRLIDAHRTLRQVARTDDMRGSRLRYACKEDQRS
jgi:hypothetical protein